MERYRNSEEVIYFDNPVEFARSVRIFEINGESFGSLEEDKVIPYWEPEQLVHILEKSHGNAVIFRAIDSNLLTFYHSSFLPYNPNLENRDLLRKMVDLCRRRGIYVFAYCCIGGAIHRNISSLYHDWSMINPDGTPVVKSGNWGKDPQLMICINNPSYIKTYIEAIKEIVREYPIAGVFFDGPSERRRCFCKYCRELFQERYGEPLPIYSGEEYEGLSESIKDKLLDFHKYSMERILSQLREAILSIRKIPIVSVIGTQTKRFIRYGFIKYSDGIMASDLESTDFMLHLMRIKTGIATGKAVWVYCPITPRQTLVTFDDYDTLLSGYLALMHGATPLIAYLDSYLHDKTGLSSVRELFIAMERNKQLFFEQKSVPHIALLCSEQTGLYYAKKEDYPFKEKPIFINYSDQEVGQWHNNYFEGAFALLTHSHQQFDVILDEDLTSEKLQNYDVLILPNSACLSESQGKAITDFVKSGGGLIALYETSLYNEKGNQRVDFLLNDLFKVRFIKKENLALTRIQKRPEPYIRIFGKHPIISGLGNNTLIPYDFRGMERNYSFIERDELNKGPFEEKILQISVLKGGETIADFYYPAGGEFGRPYSFPIGHPASIIVSEYGRGKVVYCARPLDLLYKARGLQVLRKLFVNAINWVSSTVPPFQIEAPISVVAYLTEAENQRALHLINLTGNLCQTLNFKIEYIAPIYNLNIRLAVPEGKKVKDVFLLYRNSYLDFHIVRGECSITLPELHVYECIIISYRK